MNSGSFSILTLLCQFCQFRNVFKNYSTYSFSLYSQEIMLTEDDVYDVEKRQPPRFVTQIQSNSSLVEMQATKFECQLAPVGDPNMKVEWFFNGKALPFKNRFTPIYDFGYVAMNFGWVYPEDSGIFTCRATNPAGVAECSAELVVEGKLFIVKIPGMVCFVIDVVTSFYHIFGKTCQL